MGRSVGAMMLVEEGKLDLAARLYQYLPELKDMMVGVETKDPVTGATELKREPQKRPMTVQEPTLERDDFSSNRHPALTSSWSMIFSENRCTLFGIML